MRNQSHYTETFSEPQVLFSMILGKVTDLYKKYVPSSVQNRRNVSLQKQSDTVIIACVLWTLMQEHKNQTAAYRAICSHLFNENFPERSRFCRICQNLSFVIKLIRFHFIQELTVGTDLVIVDSIPCPLCKAIRNRRATLLSEIADIGYNATKKEHYYGVKLSFFVTESGFPVNYVVSAALVHDIHMVKTLVQTSPFPQIIGDKGYLSKDLKNELAEDGITLMIPMRKNMVGADKVDNRLLGKLRKAIETVFSNLESLGIQAFNSRSYQAFKFRLESLLLVYALMLEKAKQRFGNTLRYSLGRF